MTPSTAGHQDPTATGASVSDALATATKAAIAGFMQRRRR